MVSGPAIPLTMFNRKIFNTEDTGSHRVELLGAVFSIMISFFVAAWTSLEVAMAGSYNGVAVPSDGNKIGYANGKYAVPENPIVPFIEGDGTGRDIWKASKRVFDAAPSR